ncbi:response regulator [Acetivibrio straminisolvens]|uniref:Stage 0 sporulation protein A homolog n=1 Tax=Acetivibrio straminisolvens JCM 21531 TaxID=1294263 RepID=W4V4E8_9FIRM|nr:response regulator [Acetivibrio straminisolvens]GAE87703.1 transcriptional regulator [Acetivibrio straminisolvens JCM 21531]
MLKMIIADDEQIILDGIKESIDWKSYDIEVAGTARNGIEALKLVNSTEADILVTDIRMPGLSGLELVKEIRKARQDIRIILISAYEEFEFAQEAISLGVQSYISKPLKKQKIVDEVSKARDAILKEKLEKENQTRLEEMYKNNLPILREYFHNNLIMGRLKSMGDLTKQFDLYEIDLEESNVGVVVLTVDNRTENLKDLLDKSFQLVNIRIAEMARDFMPSCYKKIIFQSYNNEVVVVYNAGSNFAAAIKDATFMAEKIKNTIFHEIQVSVSAGIGRIYPYLRDTYLSYQEAVKALNYRLVYGNNTVLYIDNVEIKEMKHAHFFNDLSETLVNFQNTLSTGMADEVMKLIKTKIYQIVGCTSIPYYYVQQVYCQLLSTLLKTLYEMNITPEQLYDTPVNLYGEVFSKNTLDEIEKWYDDLVERACAVINQKKAEKVSGVISSAVNYIKENCKRDISLGEVAEFVNLNPSYLSRLFKEEKGIQFVEYVRNIKMEMAKEMLKNSNKKIYQICEELGYQSVQYFSTIFKNTVGMTPIEYRKICKTK